jgi:hypothetical protein
VTVAHGFAQSWPRGHAADPAEAAEIVGVTVHAVYNLADRVHLPPHGPKHARRRYGAEVEARSLAQLRRRHHQPHPYWATSRMPPRFPA